jgi:hypothetical protein
MLQVFLAKSFSTYFFIIFREVDKVIFDKVSDSRSKKKISEWNLKSPDDIQLCCVHRHMKTKPKPNYLLDIQKIVALQMAILFFRFYPVITLFSFII